MGLGPGALARREGDAASKQVLGQAVSCTHQVLAQVFTSARQVTCRLVCLTERLHLGEQPRTKQGRELARIPAVGLHAHSRLGRDQRRSDQHAARVTPGSDLSLQRVAARPGLVAVAHVFAALARDPLQHPANRIRLVGDPPLHRSILTR